MNKAVESDSIEPISANFSDGLTKYKSWCDGLIQAISIYQSWAEKEGQSDAEQDLRVYETIESLKADKLYIAMVGEYSRGKSELLNALFFSDFNQRLLPSTAGRTTMCPTELLYEEKEVPCIKLLPIETRSSSSTLSEYKNSAIHWTTIHILKRGSIEELQKVFQELTKTKKVSLREAESLGLYNPNSPDSEYIEIKDGLMEVPVWRHAIINYPHPLLKKGLVILDTPGLNALGLEPELTMTMLPKAHAVLFLLAADIGVSKSDHEVWNNHIKRSSTSSNHQQLVLLNKIDVLWDDLHDAKKINATVKKQVNDTAKILNIDASNIFPISAKQGLVGKIKNDQDLLERSGLDLLEKRLVEEIIPLKHEIIREKVVYEISGRIESSRAFLDLRLSSIEKQLKKLKSLGGKNLDAIQNMVAKMRDEKKKYDKELEGFQITREALSKQARLLLGHLSMKHFDNLISKTRKEMHQSWTTHGLKSGMTTYFNGVMTIMDNVKHESEGIKQAIERIYIKLHSEYGLADLKPAELPITKYYTEFKRLEAEAEAFRNSPATLMIEQSFVIRKFFITLVSQSRQLLNECNQTAKQWFQAVGTPVFQQIKEHKASIDRDLESLRKIHENLDTLGSRISELERNKQTLEKKINNINKLLDKISKPQ